MRRRFVYVCLAGAVLGTQACGNRASVTASQQDAAGSSPDGTASDANPGDTTGDATSGPDGTPPDATPGGATGDAASGPDGTPPDANPGDTTSDGSSASGADGDAAPLYCGHPGDCSAGSFCGANGTCQAGACSGASSCIHGYTCGPGDVCTSPQPNACDSDTQCSSGALCIAGTNGNGGVCSPAASQCFDGLQCDPGDKCVAGKCVPSCTDTTDCRDGYGCNTTTGVCTTPLETCLTTNDCGSALQVCVGGACVPRSSGATCASAGDVWIDNGCIPNESATFACAMEGQLGSGAGVSGVSCAVGDICVHGGCWISCDSPNQNACAGQITLTVCKPVTAGATTHNVCGTAQDFGNQCGPGANNEACTAGTTCIDGYCR